MPAQREYKGSYPEDWPKISKRIIKQANNQCEECGLDNGALLKRRGRKYRAVSEEEYTIMKQKNEQEKQRTKQKEESASRIATRQSLDRTLDTLILGDVDGEFGYYAEGEYYPFDTVGDFEIEPPGPAAVASKAAELRELGLSRVVLQVHHKDRNPANNHDSNLIALCQYCHGAKHLD